MYRVAGGRTTRSELSSFGDSLFYKVSHHFWRLVQAGRRRRRVGKMGVFFLLSCWELGERGMLTCLWKLGD